MQHRLDYLFKTLFGCFLFLAIESNGLANWTLNLGLRNPIQSSFGLNFLYIGQDFGFEIGIGHASAGVDDNSSSTDSDGEADNEKNDSVYAGVSGDLSVLYFLTKKTVSLYLQGGFGAGIAASTGENNSASAGLGGGFAGVGMLAGDKSLYLYVGYVLIPTGVLQIGVGFGL